MTATDHPPSTTSSPRLARRALAAGVAALSVIAVPAALAATSGSDAGDTPGDTRETSTSFLEVELVRAQAASDIVAFGAQAAAAQPAALATTTTAAPETTTTAPPPPTTAAPPPPEPAPAPASDGTGYSDPSNPAAWDRLAQCEASGNWAANTGNGYYGGLQFSLSSWQAVGGTGYPHEHSRETQITMGQRLHAQGGWSHWPGCSRQLGYT